MASVLNTQLGYQKPRAMPQPGRAATPTSGVTRALAGVQPPPAAPSFAEQGSFFTSPQMPTVQQTAPNAPQTYPMDQSIAPHAAAAPAGFSFDLETDPILQQMHASAAKVRTEADASALAQQKQLAIQYGDQNYGNSIDPNTGAAAAQNPYSITANLANQYQTGTHNLDESLNQHNLFYSGERINQLANALKDYQGQQASAASAFQQGLGNIQQNRVGALMGADQSEQGAYTDAYNRALQIALAQQALAAQQAPVDPNPNYINPATGQPWGVGVPGSTPPQDWTPVMPDGSPQGAPPATSASPGYYDPTLSRYIFSKPPPLNYKAS